MSNWAGKTPTVDEWRDILEKHAKWLRAGQGGERAKLSGADLSVADLTRADLSGAKLSGAYLSGAKLSGADLSVADLTRADLTGADLSVADLTRADLTGADLSVADLTRADLTGADLSVADLTRADLTGANLSGADLSGANLSGAIGADLAIARTRILPEGDLIGWKKCRNGVIVQLLIPQAARRSHAFGRKCRAEAAVPMAIFPAGAKAESLHAEGFFYEVNVPAKPDKWDENWQNECGGGLHFYLSRIEAENHP